MVACRGGYLSIARLLVHAGCELDCVNVFKLGALHAAVKEGHANIMRLLLSRGSVFNRTNGPLVQWLDEQQAEDNRLFGEEEENAQQGIIRDWLTITRGFTPLHHAIEARLEGELLRLLLQDALPESNGFVVSRTVLIQAAGKAKLTPLECALGGEAKFGPLALPVEANITLLVQRACQPWNPALNDLWPLSFRRAVREILLISNRLGKMQGASGMVEENVWLHALSFCDRYWFAALSASCMQSRR